MTNHKCLVCGKEFHYCGNCDPDEYHDNECCSKECFEKFYNLNEFEDWFNQLLGQCVNDFQETVLQESKEDILLSWTFEVRLKYKKERNKND